MKIGVFDSGIGGEKIAQLIRSQYPQADVVSVSDTKHMPYGNKTKRQLLKLVMPQLLIMQQQGCEVIVIACNTVTTVLLHQIRKVLTVPVIGFVPMVKTAAKITNTKSIAVCATPTTLASQRYKELKQQFTSGITVIEPDCSEWAALIEQNTITQQQIRRVVDEVISQQADVIVLGCTHYHWIEQEIASLVVGRAVVLQPEGAIIRQLANIIQTLK